MIDYFQKSVNQFFCNIHGEVGQGTIKELTSSVKDLLPLKFPSGMKEKFPSEDIE